MGPLTRDQQALLDFHVTIQFDEDWVSSALFFLSLALMRTFKLQTLICSAAQAWFQGLLLNARAETSAPAFLRLSLASHPKLPRALLLLLIALLVPASWDVQRSAAANDQRRFHLEIGNCRGVSLLGRSDLRKESASLIPGFVCPRKRGCHSLAFFPWFARFAELERRLSARRALPPWRGNNVSPAVARCKLQRGCHRGNAKGQCQPLSHPWRLLTRVTHSRAGCWEPLDGRMSLG